MFQYISYQSTENTSIFFGGTMATRITNHWSLKRICPFWRCFVSWMCEHGMKRTADNYEELLGSYPAGFIKHGFLCRLRPLIRPVSLSSHSPYSECVKGGSNLHTFILTNKEAQTSAYPSPSRFRANQRRPTHRKSLRSPVVCRVGSTSVSSSAERQP